METAVATPAVPAAPPAAPAAPAPSVPASQPEGSVAAPPAASPESVGLKQLREQYETTKRDLEPWQKIGGKPEEVQTAYQTFSAMSKEALELGEQLGYDPAEVREFMAKDPVAVLAHLRQKASSTPSQASPADIRKLAAQEAQNALKPYLEQQNEQLATAAEVRGQNEFNRLLGEHFKDGIAEDVKSELYARVETALLADEKALQRMMRGQISDVTKYFIQEKDKLMKVYAAMSQSERKRTGTEPPNKPGTEKPKTWRDRTLSTGQNLGDLFNV